MNVLGAGNEYDASRASHWARWLLKGGTYSNKDSTNSPKENLSAAAAQDIALTSAAENWEGGHTSSIKDTPQVLPISQEHIRGSIKSADVIRLRFWVKTLREEVIREAAYNNHQSLLINQLRSLSDQQQRELAAARVSLKRMQSRLVMQQIEAKTVTNVSAISNQALRMAGKSRLNAQDEREAMLGLLDSLRKENAELKLKISSIKL
jgi:hypothetical protein